MGLMLGGDQGHARKGIQMKRATVRITAALVVGAALALPASAGAVTIGSDLKPAAPEGLGYGCSALDSCALIQTVLPDNPNKLTSRVNGTVRKWRYRRGADPLVDDLRLWVVKRGAGTAATFLRHSEFVTAGPEAGIYVFKTKLKISKGQQIAVELGAGDHWQLSVSHPGALSQDYFPTPSLGLSTTTIDDSSNYEFLWNASVKKPKHKKKH